MLSVKISFIFILNVHRWIGQLNSLNWNAWRRDSKTTPNGTRAQMTERTHGRLQWAAVFASVAHILSASQYYFSTNVFVTHISTLSWTGSQVGSSLKCSYDTRTFFTCQNSIEPTIKQSLHFIAQFYLFAPIEFIFLIFLHELNCL